MKTLLLAPHADDESLFAAYLAQKYAAHIVVVYDEGREAELKLATIWLGCTYEQLPVKKGAPARVVRSYLTGLRVGAYWERVITPLPDRLGHEEHNLVGESAWEIFGDLEIIRYRTYAPRGERDVAGPESLPAEPVHIARKLAALSCYRSQIEDPSTRPWFYDLLDMREWVA